MKLFTTILIFLALVLIVVNITMLNFNNLLEGDSLVALIGIAASFCAVFILIIFRISKAIEHKAKNQ